MQNDNVIIYVVDDDESVGTSLCRLLMSAGFDTELYQDASSFLNNVDQSAKGCMLLDIRMPNITGLELQKLMISQGYTLPIVFITGHGDIPMSVRAMKDGAIDFLTKPFNDVEVIDAVQAAIDYQHATSQEDAAFEEIHNRYKLLTPREQEVFAIVITGRLNKQIASELGIVEKTIKVHRSRIMEKMEARNFAELVKMGIKLDAKHPK